MTDAFYIFTPRAKRISKHAGLTDSVTTNFIKFYDFYNSFCLLCLTSIYFIISKFKRTILQFILIYFSNFNFEFQKLGTWAFAVASKS
jgi:hypothetical protein